MKTGLARRGAPRLIQRHEPMLILEPLPNVIDGNHLIPATTEMRHFHLIREDTDRGVTDIGQGWN
jgi:hypothetical protein